MEFSLDQRLRNMRVSKRELHRECERRDRKISYNTLLKVINEPNLEIPERVLYPTKKKVIDTIVELERERGITSIEFC